MLKLGQGECGSSLYYSCYSFVNLKLFLKKKRKRKQKDRRIFKKAGPPLLSFDRFFRQERKGEGLTCSFCSDCTFQLRSNTGLWGLGYMSVGTRQGRSFIRKKALIGSWVPLLNPGARRPFSLREGSLFCAHK